MCLFSLSPSVSELLMGELDSSTLLSLLPTEKSRVSSPTRQSSPPTIKKKKKWLPGNLLICCLLQSMENLYTVTNQGSDGGAFRSDLQDMGRPSACWLLLVCA